ncbi:UNVERIFIED_CONTAM: hypothetical protein FKN15_036754 [Acipenser sinensis]
MKVLFSGCRDIALQRDADQETPEKRDEEEPPSTGERESSWRGRGGAPVQVRERGRGGAPEQREQLERERRGSSAGERERERRGSRAERAAGEGEEGLQCSGYHRLKDEALPTIFEPFSKLRRDARCKRAGKRRGEERDIPAWVPQRG